MTYRLTRSLVVVALLVLSARASTAQTIGTFRWQLHPYCNVLTLTVTQNGAIYTLDGFDDQCGTAQRAGVVGTASFNPDGSVGLALTIVAAPNAVPTSIAAGIDVGSLSGPWRDSVGNIGIFVFTPGASAGGSPRPVGPVNIAPASITSTYIATHAIGGGQIDPTQVQTRVSGMCPAGHHMRGVNPDGSVVCEPSGFVKQVAFVFVIVPPVGQPPAQLATMTFVAPVSGTALFRGRGYCNLNPIVGANNSVIIAIGTSAASAFVVPPSGLGVMNVAPGSPSGLYQPGWSSDRVLEVVAGATYTVSLFARHELGNATNDCTGSFTVQLFAGALP